jgi:hypothetical protein
MHISSAEVGSAMNQFTHKKAAPVTTLCHPLKASQIPFDSPVPFCQSGNFSLRTLVGSAVSQFTQHTTLTAREFLGKMESLVSASIKVMNKA